jgi:NAD(P)H dehydrogenase (quinone)
MGSCVSAQHDQVGSPATKKAASPSVAIIYYSTYGHIKQMADEIQKGLEATGVNVDMFQVAETLSPEVLKAMHAPPKLSNVMLIDRPFLGELPKYDGLMFGIPTRFGSPAAQMKAFFDSTGQLWQSGALAGKLAATFVSTGTQNGGQEITHFTALTNLVHHGMVYVPLGYQAGAAGQFDMNEVHGGSPWGAGTLAGADGSRQPSALELSIAKKHAAVFGTKVKKSLAAPTQKTFKVCIVYYSMYGHIKTMADEIASSIKEAGVAVDVFQAPELLPTEVLEKMGAARKPSDPVMDYSKVSSLADYDGFMFGIPTRFGGPAAQMKAFFDSTGQLWQSGALAGKLAATFVSTGTQNGGQETTHFTALTNLVHHGMVYVPLGYQAGGEGQFDMNEVHGGSPWGASTLAGADGSRQPAVMELKIARKHGQVFAAKVKQLAQ